MTSKNIYLERYAHPEQLISSCPQADLGVVITIPCYNEPNLISSLQSLQNSRLPTCAVEVMVIINHSKEADEVIKAQNQLTYEQAITWAEAHSETKRQYHIHLCELPPKHAGVGLARKIAMDEAVRRLEQVNHPHGIITCFDADSLCQENYFVEIEKHFNKHPKSPGCSIYFEHPLSGPLNQDIYQAITEYELFLRYYTHTQKYCGLPYAYQTIGSSMAVRSNAYQKQGGMNRRKAGEDFYFLHKIIALGHFTELTDTTVIPSPRQSDRVPFGTGKAVSKWLEEKSLNTYAPQTFIDLKLFTDQVDRLWLIKRTEFTTLIKDLPKSIRSFLMNNDFESSLMSIKNNSASKATFVDKCHRWFDAFKLLKYVHYSRDHYYPNISVLKASQWLLESQYSIKSHSEVDALLAFRGLDLA